MYSGVIGGKSKPLVKCFEEVKYLVISNCSLIQIANKGFTLLTLEASQKTDDLQGHG